MPVALSYPGVYIQEVPSGVHTITGVATSIAGFVGYFSRGSTDKAERILSLSDFERQFGGLRLDSLASYAIQQFFLNGGQQAWVVRTASGTPLTAQAPLGPAWTVTAANAGKWGERLSVSIDHAASPANAFHLTVRETVDAVVVRSETFRNLSPGPSDARYAVNVLEAESKLVRLVPPSAPPPLPDVTSGTPLINGHDGDLPDVTALSAALEKFDAVDLVNLICVPDTARLQVGDAKSVIQAGITYVDAPNRRAFYLIDPPDNTKGTIEGWLATITPPTKNAAVYFPRVVIADPLDGQRPRAIPNSGTIAGVYARTDTERGVWKAPAGLAAVMRSVQSLEYSLTDAEDGILNVLGLNCLRTFRNAGPVVWGARTLDGSDATGSEWKYVSVRRLALYLEESLYRGTQFAVFEPNDEPLWSQIRLNLGTFMHSLFLQGAFQGASARDAYFVKCDRETTTQADIDHGVVNIIVGFAPLKPAEFVVISFTQITGGAQA